MANTKITKTSLVGYAHFAKLHVPDRHKRYGNKYVVDLAVTDEEGKPVVVKDASGTEVNMLEKAKELNLKIEDKDWGSTVRLIRKEKNRKGDENGPVPVFQMTASGKKRLTPDTLIGNGSMIAVQFSAIPWEDTDTGDSGVTTHILETIVYKLKTYDTGEEYDIEVTQEDVPEEEVAQEQGQEDDDDFDD